MAKTAKKRGKGAWALVILVISVIAFALYFGVLTTEQIVESLTLSILTSAILALIFVYLLKR